MDYTYIMVTRTGGTGDILMLEPTIEALYYKYAPARIIFRTYERDYNWVLAKHPLVWKQIWDDYPCNSYGHKESGWINSDLKGLFPTQQRILHINLGGVVESLNGMHGVDCFAAAANVRLLRRTPSFGHFNFNDYHDVVVQLRDNSDGRGLTRDQLPMDLLESATFIEPGVVLKGEDYLDTIVGADVFIGSDSSGLHMAYAAGVRHIVGLYDDRFPAQLRAYPGMQTARSPEELRWMVASALATPRYPDYLNGGNAMEGIRGKAMQYCKGRGLDVGSSTWPLEGALALPTENDRHMFDLAPFDYIFSSHCLEHIDNWQDELKLWANSIKVGGMVFMYLPHPRMEKWRALDGEWSGPWHRWNPSPMALVQWLHENTTLRVDEYTAYPDAYWSFHIIARRTA